MYHDARLLRQALGTKLGARMVSIGNLTAVLAALAEEDLTALGTVIAQVATADPRYAPAVTLAHHAARALSPDYRGGPGDRAPGKEPGPDLAAAGTRAERLRDALPEGSPERASAARILRSLRQDLTAAFPSISKTALLCDECFEAGTGFLAECQDLCRLPLDHDGLCGESPQPESPAQCHNCGGHGRLHQAGLETIRLHGELPLCIRCEGLAGDRSHLAQPGEDGRTCAECRDERPR
jgi:hypothetical protein